MPNQSQKPLLSAWYQACKQFQLNTDYEELCSPDELKAFPHLILSLQKARRLDNSISALFPGVLICLLGVRLFTLPEYLQAISSSKISVNYSQTTNVFHSFGYSKTKAYHGNSGNFLKSCWCNCSE